MYTDIGQDIKKARDLILRGEVVAVPTETVYGLAADMTNEEAVKKIFEIKKRPSYNPLIVHVRDGQMMIKYVDYDKVPHVAYYIEAIDAFLPGPLTLVLPKKDLVPDIVTAGLDTVAIRMPEKHTMMHHLIKAVGRPLVAASANLFGRLSPTKAEHVLAQLDGKIPYILESDEDIKYGIESTILNFMTNPPEILRLGAISKKELEKEFSRVFRRRIRLNVVDKVKLHPLAPGMLPKHYAPKTKLVLFSVDLLPKIDQLLKQYKVGILDINRSLSRYKDKAAAYLDLSTEGHVEEAAKNLYDYLYQLDKAGLDLIIVASIPERGVGQAIRDRLRRAAINK